MQPKQLFVLSILFIVLMYSACSHAEILHSVLESSPYIDHSMHSNAIRVTGKTGLAVFLNGYYDRMTTDTDTTIDVYNGQVGLRGRFMDVGDAGFTFNTTFDDSKLYGYGIMDIKFYLLDEKVGLYPDIGFGAGMGTFAWSFDTRMSIGVNVKVLEDVASIYAAPRLIGLMYPYYEEISGGITVSYSYAMMPLYGFNAGMTFSVPIEQNGIDLLITPNINYLLGHEPKGDQVDVSVFQAGCSFGITF